jgi:hypothetical protein
MVITATILEVAMLVLLFKGTCGVTVAVGLVV